MKIRLYAASLSALVPMTVLPVATLPADAARAVPAAPTAEAPTAEAPGTATTTAATTTAGSATVLVSARSDGAAGNNTSVTPDVSGNGRYVAFASHATNLVPGDTNNRMDVFVRDTAAGTTAGDGTAANSHSADPSLSFDGDRIAFSSAATNLVPGDANARDDVYARLGVVSAAG